uniref:Reverse transcriptase domain-containing protein n=1 Tax=Salvator merianae TaxID=96440 RepID=A0A8D0KMT4_SALMN
IIYHTKKHEKLLTVTILDIEKAFDTIFHTFLFQVLTEMEFGDEFINLIHNLYRQNTEHWTENISPS